jgi:hypothetical protein
MTTMTFDRLAYIDRLKAAGVAEPQARAMADGLEQALREKVATKSDVRKEIDLLRLEFRNELGMFKGDLLAAMKANKIYVLKWLVMLIIGQMAFLTSLKLLGH